MHSKNESVAVRAAKALLDRGYGRPMQGMEMVEKEEGADSHADQSHIRQGRRTNQQ
jgi:hypothetical protein